MMPGREDKLTRLQQLAYDAQLAANLPSSDVARDVLSTGNEPIGVAACADYLTAVQAMAWFKAAFPSHGDRITVTGGRGISHADNQQRKIKIGIDDRQLIGQCEQACLHELAHIVSSDYGADGQLREPQRGRYSSKGHHHAWRANFIFIVNRVVGKQAATRLRHEFNHWGLHTRT